MDYYDKPEIKIKNTSGDKFLEILNWAALMFLWISSYWVFTLLPDTIAVHFDLAGNPDNYGSRYTIFATAIVCTLVSLFLSFLNRNPQFYNYAVKITAQNAELHYRLSARFMRVLRLSLILIFQLVVYIFYYTSTSEKPTSPAWIFPVILSMIFVPVAVYIYLSLQLKKKETPLPKI